MFEIKGTLCQCCKICHVASKLFWYFWWSNHCLQ